MKHAVKHIHFVGIGGAGMSAIAEILHHLGYRVSGSDAHGSAVTQRLASLGIRVFIGHAAHQIEGAQAVVTSTAVKADNPEVLAARARRVPVVARAVLLAELMRLKQGIAVAGTHGKTTTTSLVASVLAEAGLDPTFVIGGALMSAGANSRLGAGEHIVVEADESDASFLHLSPVISVVTNIDADHMETYGHDLARLRSAFVEFLHRLPFYGRAVLCVDDPGVAAIVPRLERPITGYGLGPGADVRATRVEAVPGGRMRFIAERRDPRATDGERALPPLPVTLNLAGEHNVRNALAAIAVAMELELPDAPVAAALEKFAGVGRRFQRWGDLPAPQAAHAGRFTLIDDYGHHPVEMAAVLAAARGAFPGRRLVLAFQPHRYSRTRDCFEDFVAVLGRFDAVLLTEVYPAGEAPIAGADGAALARALGVAGRADASFVESVEALPAAIARTARAGDVVITMGAGSIGQVPQRVLEIAGGEQ
jgi:UDP-N-acetylmuramate--alanine ligase